MMNVLKIINEMRRERNLGSVHFKPKEVRVTRDRIRQICIEVWTEKYPKSLTDADFVLGELTAKLVEKEVERRILIEKGKLLPRSR